MLEQKTGTSGSPERESETDTAQRDSQAQAKTRKCLMCQSPFASSWAGERVCRKCESSNTWRTA